MNLKPTRLVCVPHRRWSIRFNGTTTCRAWKFITRGVWRSDLMSRHESSQLCVMVVRCPLSIALITSICGCKIAQDYTIARAVTLLPVPSPSPSTTQINANPAPQIPNCASCFTSGISRHHISRVALRVIATTSPCLPKLLYRMILYKPISVSPAIHACEQTGRSEPP